MKLSFLLAAVSLILVSCGSPQPAQRGTTVNISSASPGGDVLSEKRISCVAQGGFLVPSGGDFNCRLPNGNVVSLWNL